MRHLWESLVVVSLREVFCVLRFGQKRRATLAFYSSRKFALKNSAESLELSTQMVRKRIFVLVCCLRATLSMLASPHPFLGKITINFQHQPRHINILYTVHTILL